MDLILCCWTYKILNKVKRVSKLFINKIDLISYFIFKNVLTLKKTCEKNWVEMIA